MKIKVDHLTSKEFSEYADSTFAKPVKMSLGIFLGIIMTVLACLLFTGKGGGAVKPLFITAFILAALYILSGAVLGTAYKKSGLADTRCAYSLDEGGMDIKMGDLSGDLSWSYVKYVKETKNLFIIRAKGSQFIIPKRCLKSAEFREFIKNTLPEEKIKRLKYTIDKETEDNGD